MALYARQPFPDNHVPDSFLDKLVTNGMSREIMIPLALCATFPNVSSATASDSMINQSKKSPHSLPSIRSWHLAARASVYFFAGHSRHAANQRCGRILGKSPHSIPSHLLLPILPIHNLLFTSFPQFLHLDGLPLLLRKHPSPPPPPRHRRRPPSRRLPPGSLHPSPTNATASYPPLYVRLDHVVCGLLASHCACATDIDGVVL